MAAKPAPFEPHLAKKLALKPDDMAGLRIRTGGGQPSEIVKSLGAVPVALAVPETYNAMERGVVDGTILPYEAAKAFKLAEVEKHVVAINIFTTSQFTIMNLDKYNALPADLRAVIDELSGNWGAEFAGAAWDRAEEEGLEAIRKAGVQLHKIRKGIGLHGGPRPRASRRSGCAPWRPRACPRNRCLPICVSS